MPTIRLGDNERSEIRGKFHRVLSRAANNKQFPLAEEEIAEFGYSLLEPRIAKYYEFLRDEATDLTSAASWNPEFRIRDTKYVYEITLHGCVLPKEHLLLPECHAMHRPILVWAQEQYAIEERISNAQSYLYAVVEACCSMGQIHRVLPEDILRFVPEYMQDSIQYAERRSRWPSSLPHDQEKLDALADTLALGAISPENREGIDTTLTRTEI